MGDVTPGLRLVLEVGHIRSTRARKKLDPLPHEAWRMAQIHAPDPSSSTRPPLPLPTMAVALATQSSTQSCVHASINDCGAPVALCLQRPSVASHSLSALCRGMNVVSCQLPSFPKSGRVRTEIKRPQNQIVPGRGGQRKAFAIGLAISLMPFPKRIAQPEPLLFATEKVAK